MTFGWPWMLLGLLTVPAVVLWYRRLVRARAARRTELAALGLVAPAAVSRGRRRHLAPALLLVAFVLLVTALARPAAQIPQPTREGTVIIAFDVSASMAATDIAPTRMEAAKAAARGFVQGQPETVRIGVVAFGGTGLITQEPTADRTGVLAAIDRLGPQGGTGLGSGLLTALGAVVGRPIAMEQQTGGAEPNLPDLGYHGSSAILLLSDGENTDELDPLQIADMASGAGVKVYPVGIGSPAGTVLEIDGFQVATRLDEQTLRAVAERTDGQYFNAPDEQSLAAISDSVVAWTVRTEQLELTAPIGALAAVLLLVGVGLSVVWFGRAV
jgi:Ca-activated chloride channel family protein